MYSPLMSAMHVATWRTANGAVTHTSSLDPVLDLFFIAGASRNMDEGSILHLFSSAYNQDRNTTIRILFWARDVRGWAGERRFFRVCWKYLLTNHPEEQLLSKHVPTYGRYDDLYETLSHTHSLATIVDAIRSGDSLACKWAPRKWPTAKLLTRALTMTPKQYRQHIVAHTTVVETQMCKKQWSEIEYKKIPSVAFHKYIRAWKRNDESRFTTFITDVKEGKTTLHAETLFPYQVYQSYKEGHHDVVAAQWKHLADYTWEDSILPVIDVSWSMEGLPKDISISLWVYLSERIKWPFQDHIISFDGHPRVHRLSGSIIDRFTQCERSSLDMSTNLLGVFESLLQVARHNKLTQEDMPKKLLIISDMEFNSCSNVPNYQAIKNLYEQAGYQLPYLVFWNVNGREGNLPITATEFWGMVSGASPSIIKGIMSGTFNTPRDLMMATVFTPRYDPVIETLT